MPQGLGTPETTLTPAKSRIYRNMAAGPVSTRERGPVRGRAKIPRPSAFEPRPMPSDPMPDALRSPRKPRVLLLSPYFFPVLGGAETAAMGVARYLQAHDYPVFVVTKRILREHPLRETVQGVPVRRIPPVGRRSGFAKWIMLPSTFAALVRWRHDYDVIFNIDYRGVGIAAVCAGRLVGRPVLVRAETTGVVSCGNWDSALRRAGLNPRGLIARAITAPIRAFYRRADAHACLMASIEQETLDAGVPASRVHRVAHGIDMRLFRPPAPGEAPALREGLGWPRDRVVCLYLGRLSLEKGALDLLDVWNRIRPAGATLVLAGPDMDGHPWNVGPQAREFVRTHGLADSVTFHGPTDDAPRLLRAADVFVLPSHFEALSVAAIEASAAGLPIVATAVGGIGDYMVDGVNGVLVPPRDPERLADALTRVMADPGLRGRLGREARTRAEHLFSEDAVYGRLAGILTALAFPPATRPGDSPVS